MRWRSCLAVVFFNFGVKSGRTHSRKSNGRYVSSKDFFLMKTTISKYYGLHQSEYSVSVHDAGSKGRGLFATRSIRKDVLIGLYEGEVLTQREYEERYPSGQSSYAFLLRNDCQRRDRIYIDSANETRSNQMRFMNHSPQPNVQPFMTVFRIPKNVIPLSALPPFVGVAFDCGGRDLSLYTIAFRTITSVCAGEELQFDYGDQYPAEGFL